MKFDEVMGSIDSSGRADPDGLLRVIKSIPEIEDISAGERGAFAVGVMLGISYILQMYNEGRGTEAALNSVSLMAVFERATQP